MNVNMQSGFNFQSMQSLSGNQNAAPPPPPPEQGELSGYVFETRDTAATTEFMQEFMDSSFSGDFDVESLVQNAPDSLKAYAENNGVALEDMLTAAHERLQSHGKNGSGHGIMQPPSGMQGNASSNALASSYLANSLQSSSQNMVNNLLNSMSIRVTA